VKLKTFKSTLLTIAMFAAFAVPPIAMPSMRTAAVHAFQDLSGGIRKTAGLPRSGDLVYFMLPTGPNTGKPRPATVVRAYAPGEMRQADGSFANAVDLVVDVLTEDGVTREQLKVPEAEVGSRFPGTWDWQEPQEPGF